QKTVPIACPSQVRNLAVDAQDFVYVTCYNAGRVVVFDPGDVAVDQIVVSAPSGVAILPAMP
ncbi:MAG TPA: hypothetical protein VIK91_04590, partial [Nannocystis sp.]